MPISSRTTALILAHVALLGACKSGPSPVPDENLLRTPTAADPVPTAPTADPNAAPKADPTAAPTASAPAAPVATTPPETPPWRDTTNAVCTSDEDCSGLLCQKTRAKDGTLAESGRCRAAQPTRGRALVVDDDVHVARVVSASSPRFDAPAGARALALLREVAEEHASIAAFARTTCELMALGAPLSLLRETARALADEVEHTERTLAWATRITGKSMTIAALPAAAAPLREGPAQVPALFRDVFRGGAVGETLAAAIADEESLRGPEEMREHYRVLAEDEARHAALAFTTLGWLLETYPSLAVVRDEETASFFATATAEQRALVAPLLVTLGHHVPALVAEG